MADYEEQDKSLARQVVARTELADSIGDEHLEEVLETMSHALAKARRTAAEDATRRERERHADLAAAARLVRSRTHHPVESCSGCEWCDLFTAIEELDATPPPPRPATGETQRLRALVEELWDHHCDGVCHPCEHEHLAGRVDDALAAPTPPARTDADAIGDFQRKLATAGVSISTPARTEHASEHATSHVGSKPARTEDGGRCARCGHERRAHREASDRGAPDWRDCQVARCPCGTFATPPPEPEAARGEDEGAVREVHATPEDMRAYRRAMAGPEYAALVEAARAVLPLLYFSNLTHCRYCSRVMSMDHAPGCTVAALRAALAGVES